MRVSVVVLLCALAGILGGGALIGLPALGGCLIFVSLCTGLWALDREYDERGARPSVHGIGATVHDILERARAS